MFTPPVYCCNGFLRLCVLELLPALVAFNSSSSLDVTFDISTRIDQSSPPWRVDGRFRELIVSVNNVLTFEGPGAAARELPHLLMLSLP